ncbi:MAG: nucleotidyltransferase family protein [Fibrobacter sp.]|nr:nucleotidyltransferase family protein [Fibrobacter sp.]
MIGIVKNNATVLEALAAINESKNLTVFVTDEKGTLQGSLTDGDVRRYLLKGGLLSDGVMNAAHKDYAKVFSNDDDVLRKLKEFKSKGIKQVPSVDGDGKIIDIYDLVSYKSHLPIDAVLMAGGKGERLRPLTEKTPKPLLPVGDKSIIDHNVDRLISYGVKHISVTVNYLKEQIEEHYAMPRNGVKVDTCREPQFLGTIGSIKFVESFYNDSVLVMNSDLFTNIDYEDFYLHFKQHDAEMSVAAVPYDVSIPYGILDLDGRDIKGLLEKPKYNYYANAGIYLIKKSALDEIPNDTFFNATDLVEKLIAENKKVIRYPLNGTWIDIGNPQEYQKAKDLVKHLR